MKILDKERDFETIVNLIKSGEVICSPTDTQMGLIGSALNKNSIKKVYKIKRRTKGKPLIILFSDIDQVREFGVEIPEKFESLLKSIWPERLTVILPLSDKSPFKDILKRENIAVRVPKNEFLLKLIKETSPLFAPSANPEGEKPAKDCRDCEDYFKDKVKFCIGNGQESELPSTIVDLTKETPKVLRKGAFNLHRLL